MGGRGFQPTFQPIYRTALLPLLSSSLARLCIQSVTSVSAGPPLGGLYLMPPSVGGLCRRGDDDAVGEVI